MAGYGGSGQLVEAPYSGQAAAYGGQSAARYGGPAAGTPYGASMSTVALRLGHDAGGLPAVAGLTHADFRASEPVGHPPFFSPSACQ